MTCHDLRRATDSFMYGELTYEMNQEVLRHLDSCSTCREEIHGQRRLRSAVGTAVRRAPDLQPSVQFTMQLRNRLRTEVEQDRGHARSRRSWLAVAAGLVLAVGVTAALVFYAPTVSAQALAQDAIGDHRNCALKFRSVRTPVPLSEAADRFDRAFRVLLSRPPEDIPTPGGSVRVIERHACAYDTRRFGHVIMQYRGHVVSLLMTTAATQVGSLQFAGAAPRVIGRSSEGLSVVSITGSRHTFLLVGDLGTDELRQLFEIIARPLADRLEGGIE